MFNLKHLREMDSGLSLYYLGIAGTTLYGAWSIWTAIDIATDPTKLGKSPDALSLWLGQNSDIFLLKIFAVLTIVTVGSFILTQWWPLLKHMNEQEKEQKEATTLTQDGNVEVGRVDPQIVYAKVGIWAAVGLMLAAEVFGRIVIFASNLNLASLFVAIFVVLFFAIPMFLGPSVSTIAQKARQAKMQELHERQENEETEKLLKANAQIASKIRAVTLHTFEKKLAGVKDNPDELYTFLQRDVKEAIARGVLTLDPEQIYAFRNQPKTVVVTEIAAPKRHASSIQKKGTTGPLPETATILLEQEKDIATQETKPSKVVDINAPRRGRPRGTTGRGYRRRNESRLVSE